MRSGLEVPLLDSATSIPSGMDSLRKLLLRGISSLVGIWLYAAVLHWVYANFITERFRYLGYPYVEPGAYSLAVAYIAAWIVSMLLPFRLKTASSVVLWILFVIVLIPALFVPTFVGYQSEMESVVSSIWYSMAFALTAVLVRRLGNAKPRPLMNPPSPTTFWLVVAGYSVFVYLLLTLTIGLSLNFVALADVYDQRDEYKLEISGAPAIVTYLVSTQANAINPLIIAKGIASKKWTVLVLGLLGQALLYSETGFKTVLFSVPLVIVLTLLLRGGRQIPSIWLVWSATAVIVASALVDYLQDDFLWTSMFARRFMVTPGLLTAAYMDYYSSNEFALLGHSVLSPITGGADSVAPAMAVGEWMSGNAEMSANANLFADGFANFGVAGIFGAGIVLAVYLRFLDRAASGLPFAVVAAVVVMPAITLANTSVLTAMLSHGLVAAFLVLLLAPRDGWTNAGGPRQELPNGIEFSRQLPVAGK